MSIVPFLSTAALSASIEPWRAKGFSIGLVPTMGALHSGHIHLVKELQKKCDKVVVSIFVNPLQFGPSEDFAIYPRTLPADLEMLSAAKVDAVFAPSAREMYPDDFQTTIHNSTLSANLCGKFRPGHFDGVLTVVYRLFHLIKPNRAIFGKKDYQQWKIIERMTLDLGLDVDVLGAETVRESDGLAMSSRNRYLTPEHRENAAVIYQGLAEAKKLYRSGVRSSQDIIKKFSALLGKYPGMEIQYAELVNAKNLAMLSGDLGNAPVCFMVAVIYGGVRLIDNIEFEEAVSSGP